MPISWVHFLRKRSYTDTASFTLRCGVCQIGVIGQKVIPQYLMLLLCFMLYVLLTHLSSYDSYIWLLVFLWIYSGGSGARTSMVMLTSRNIDDAHWETQTCMCSLSCDLNEHHWWKIVASLQTVNFFSVLLKVIKLNNFCLGIVVTICVVIVVVPWSLSTVILIQRNPRPGSSSRPDEKTIRWSSIFYYFSPIKICCQPYFMYFACLVFRVYLDKQI